MYIVVSMRETGALQARRSCPPTLAARLLRGTVAAMFVWALVPTSAGATRPHLRGATTATALRFSIRKVQPRWTEATK